MLRKDYLKLAIANKLYEKKKWLISCITVNNSPKSPDQEELYLYNDRQFYYTLVDGVETRIEDARADSPLFPIDEYVMIDSSIYPGLKGEIKTTYGNLIFNLLCIYSPFGTKVAYRNGAINPKALEAELAELMVDNTEGEKDPTKIYVDEYLNYGKGLKMVAFLSPFITNSGGPRMITAAKGLEAKKKELLAKYGDSLKDPVVYAHYEKELLAFGAEHLKDDPGWNKFITGKIAGNAYRKMFLTMGIELGFDDRTLAPPILRTLKDGQPLTAKEFATVVNGSRYGSYSRGSETVKGGVSAKALLRSLSPYTVVEKDCGSQLGIVVKLGKEARKYYSGRYISTTKGLVHLTKDVIEEYVGKTVILRSPMYCKLSGDNICSVCGGTNLLSYPNGLAIPATEISSVVLTTALKKMHTNQLAAVEFDLQEALN
jgi:hypothetical protein